MSSLTSLLKTVCACFKVNRWLTIIRKPPQASCADYLSRQFALGSLRQGGLCLKKWWCAHLRSAALAMLSTALRTTCYGRRLAISSRRRRRAQTAWRTESVNYCAFFFLFLLVKVRGSTYIPPRPIFRIIRYFCKLNAL